MDSLNNNDTKHVGSAGSNREMSHKKSESSGIGSLMDPRRKSWMVEERSYIKCSPPVRIGENQSSVLKSNFYCS